MKKILFIGILAIISSTPAYAAASGQGAGHGVGQGAGHGAGGRQMGAKPSGAISNNAAKPRQHKKMQAGGPLVEDIAITQVRNRHRAAQAGGPPVEDIAITQVRNRHRAAQ